jgi:hypothetical protein
MADPIPSEATSIFFYSPRHQSMRDQVRMPRLSYAASNGTKAAYTKEIAADQPDTEAQIADYQKQFPDARVVGYGTKDTQKLSSVPPMLAFSLPH